MKNLSLWIIVLLSIVCKHVHAQSAYHGGKGDGYASAEVHNIVLAIEPSGALNELISVYPNPAENSQRLEILCEGIFEAEIWNLMGVPVFSDKHSSGLALIPLDRISPGTYFLIIRSGNQRFIRKIVII